MERLKRAEEEEQRQLAEMRRRASILSQINTDENASDEDIATSGWSTAPKLV